MYHFFTGWTFRNLVVFVSIFITIHLHLGLIFWSYQNLNFSPHLWNKYTFELMYQDQTKNLSYLYPSMIFFLLCGWGFLAMAVSHCSIEAYENACWDAPLCQFLAGVQQPHLLGDQPAPPPSAYGRYRQYNSLLLLHSFFGSSGGARLFLN